MARSNRRSFWKSFTRNFFGFFSRERAGQIASPVTRRKIGLEQLETRWVPATVSWATGVLSIQTDPNETISVVTSSADNIAYTTSGTWTVNADAGTAGFADVGGVLTGNLVSSSTGGVTIIGSTGSETANIASGYSTSTANLTILAPFETVNQLGTATYKGLNISAVSTTLSGDVQVVGGDFDLRDTTTTIGANITINTAFGSASGGTLTMGSVDGPVGGALADLTLTSGSANIGFSNALGLFRPFGTITIGAANDVAMQLTRADVFNQSTQSTAAIHFYGPLTTTTSATINAASVDIAANITTPTLSIASAGAITGSNGALVVSGTTTLSAAAGADITLNNGNNDFGTVNISSGQNADITDKNAIILGTTTLSARIVLRTGGDVTQTGVLTLPSTSYFNVANNNITLTNPANNFGGLDVWEASTASFVDVDACNLPRVINVGTLNLTAGGNVVGNASPIVVSQALTIDATGYDVALTSPNQGGNQIIGVISVTAQNLTFINSGSTVFGTTKLSGTLSVGPTGGGSNLNISQTGPISVAGNASFTASTGKSIDLSTQTNSFGGSLTFGGTLLDLGLKTNSAIALAAVTLTGNLTAITSAGDITQTGALVVPGTTTLSAGTDNITLSDAGNNFGTVNITSANVATLNDTSDIILGTSSATTLNVTAAGNITQSGAITTTGNATFTVGSGKGIDLSTSINSFGGVLTFGPSSGSLSFLGLNTDSAISLAAMNLSGYLTAITSGGKITQTGTLVVAGTTTLSSNVNITLSDAGNDFGTVNITSADVATLNDTNDLVLGTSAVNGLDVTAGGNITQSGAITTTSDATFTVGTGKSVDLSTQTNSFGGSITFGGTLLDLGLKTNSAIALAAVTLTGNLTAITSGGNITQTGAVVVAGATTLAAGTNNITLSDAGNDFGTVNITSGNVVTLRDSNAIDLGNITTTGATSITAVGITQASGATLDAGSGTIKLNAGGGNITAQGTITTTSSSATALQVQSGNVVSLGVVNVASGTVELSSITGSASFTGNLTAGGLTVIAGAYDVALTGATNNITASAVNFLNTGNLTLGDSATDSTTFGQGFSSSTQANIFLAGQILTGVDLYLGGASSPITLVANTTVGLSPTASWTSIYLNSKVDGAYSMGIIAELWYGLSQPIGSTTPLTSFQFNGANGAITANVTTNGPQTYNYLGGVLTCPPKTVPLDGLSFTLSE